MTPERERVFAALEWRSSDMVAFEYSGSKMGPIYEHGQKIIDLWEKYPDDFGRWESSQIVAPNPANFDENGNYYELYKDKFGTTWEIHDFGECGHPCRSPIETEEQIKDYKFPPTDHENESDFLAYKKLVKEHKKKYFCQAGWINLFERLIEIRGFEETLMDIAMDTDEINLLADRVVEYEAKNIQGYLDAGADGILFGEDYGSQQNLLMSPDTWRRFIKPRLKKLTDQIKASGAKAMLHSCGQVFSILPDIKEIGIDSLWPQLALYNDVELAEKCRDIKLALALHLDRSNLMYNGSPSDIRAAVDRAVKVFRPQEGGSWFYFQADTGFSYENIEALITSIAAYR